MFLAIHNVAILQFWGLDKPNVNENLGSPFPWINRFEKSNQAIIFLFWSIKLHYM